MNALMFFREGRHLAATKHRLDSCSSMAKRCASLASIERSIRRGCEKYDDWCSQSSNSKQLHSRKFWETFYKNKDHTKQASDFEWFVDASAAGRFVLENIDSSMPCLQMLHVGAGTSNLGPLLEEKVKEKGRGQLKVTNVDISHTAVSMMQSAFPGHDWQVLDVADVGRRTSRVAHQWDQRFGIIMDKGALDAVLFGGVDLTSDFLFGCARLLKKERGVWIQISDDPPERRLGLLRAALPKAWKIRYQRVGSKDGGGQESLFDQEHWGYVISPQS